MKTFLLLCPLSMLLVFAVWGQDFSATAEVVNPDAFASDAPQSRTNTTPSSAVVAAIVAATNRIEIESDHAELHTETNYTAVYTGNVKATYGEANLTCHQLTIRAEKGAERPDYMLADRSVVINHVDKDGNPVNGTGDQAIYALGIEDGATNELITLKGDARLTSNSGTIDGDLITWNLTTGIISLSRQRTIIDLKKDGAANVPFGTSRASRTNAP